MTFHYLVDKQHPLPQSYYPDDLVHCTAIPFINNNYDYKHCISAAAEPSLYQLYLASYEAGLHLCAISAFRSYERQQDIYLNSICENGLLHTKKYIAFPGTSEHQTGLAIDLSCASVNYELTEDFADTKEGIWLSENCNKFNFVLSYPEGNSEGYGYEPWHIRYTCNDAIYYV